MILIIILSLIVIELIRSTNPLFTFYLLPTRVFEILIGVLISVYFKNNINHKYNDNSYLFVSQTLSIVGFILLIVSIITFNNKIPYPSIFTLVPTIGAALIIIYGRNNTLVGKVLGHDKIVNIGIISYSTYLWHQPLFAFVRLKNADILVNSLVYLICLLSFLFAYISYKYIEKPFRSRKKLTQKLFC